jgi:hypothetical protein
MSGGALPWLTLAGLGAYHGLNPAMGWLFAVSRGLQQRDRRAVLDSLLPIAIGHELSLALVALALFGASAAIDPGTLRLGAAAVLLAFGIFRFVRPRAHVRWTRMNVNRRELALWSFLMSSAHGAGLMVAPVLLGLEASGANAALTADDRSHVEAARGAPLVADALGLALHVGAMLVVMGIVAVLVYEKLGVEVLRRAWLNTDQAWAAAFVVAAGITLFVT